MTAPVAIVKTSVPAIRELIDEWAAKKPDQTFLISPENGDAITFQTLQNRVRAISQSISKRGIKPGQSVAYALGNSTEAATTILGILYGGYLATAINLVAGNDVITYVLEHSETKLIFANEAGLKAIDQPLKALPTIPVETRRPQEIDDTYFESETEWAELGGLLMYTSGTTGRPKGVVLSQQNLLAGGTNTALAHQLTKHDRGMCVLPLYHINGLCVTVMGALVSGGSLVIPAKFSVSSFWDTIADNLCTWFSVVPTQISYLLHEESPTQSATALKQVRFGRSASAPLSPDVQSAFEEKFKMPIIETMGLTETAAQILSNPLPPGIRKIGSPGIAFGNEVIIADEKQNELPRGTEGEVLVRGPNVMRYYLKNAEATAETITKQGWLRTGDLGKMDDDGYVYITGRLKELIIKGGENIAPREIDEALYSHSDVIEAAAFACPCKQYGERVEAAVMIAEQANVSEKELLELCNARLGKFKSPDRIHFLPELPKGPSGKIQRMKLAELLF